MVDVKESRGDVMLVWNGKQTPHFLHIIHTVIIKWKKTMQIMFVLIIIAAIQTQMKCNKYFYLLKWSFAIDVRAKCCQSSLIVSLYEYLHLFSIPLFIIASYYLFISEYLNIQIQFGNFVKKVKAVKDSQIQQHPIIFG